MRHKTKRMPFWEFVLWVGLFALATVGLRYGWGKFQKAMYPFPEEYRTLIEETAEAYELSPSLVCGVIYTESRFFPDAQSHAGASGLMQITPIALEWVKGDANVTEEDLSDPSVNVEMGCRVLHRLISHFQYEDTALAAYNAGIGNVTGWLADRRYSSDGRTLSKIPFSETAQYIPKVHQAQNMYQKLYGLS